MFLNEYADIINVINVNQGRELNFWILSHKDGGRTEENMSVNGVSGAGASYGMTAYEKTRNAGKNAAETEAKDKDTSKEKSKGVVYESSMSKSDRAALIEQLKADNQAKTDSFKKMVTDMLGKQGHAFKKSDDMWKMLASGNFTVDSKTAQDAKNAISENGYWGVNQTSDRIFEMAKAFAGDDVEKLDKMMEAVKKGYKQAEKAWGGKLPGICSETYDAAFQKYEDYRSGLMAE